MNPVADQPWAREVTSAFTRALGAGYELTQEAADRHGSLEWVARAHEGDHFVVVTLSPLEGGWSDRDIPPALVVAAWPISADAEEIDPRKVFRQRLNGSRDREGLERLADAVSATTKRAADPAAAGSWAALRQRGDALIDAARDRENRWLTATEGAWRIAIAIAIIALGTTELNGGSAFHVVLVFALLVPAVLLAIAGLTDGFLYPRRGRGHR